MMPDTRTTTVADGIPVTVEREGDRVAIHAVGFGDVTSRLRDVARDLLNCPASSFRLTGSLALYRGWTVQPCEVCAAFLEDSGAVKGLRPLLLLSDVESIAGQSVAGTDPSERYRILVESFPDSELIQKRPPRELESLTPDDPCFAGERSDEAARDDRSLKPAVDLLYSCGLLDLEGVETRLVKMRQRFEAWENEVRNLRDRLALADAEKESLAPLVELGRESAGRLRDEALARLRAIGLARGESPQDDARSRVFASPDTDLGTLRELHRRVTEEFRALYPTEPQSVPASPAGSVRARWDWGFFRIGETNHENGSKTLNRKP